MKRRLFTLLSALSLLLCVSMVAMWVRSMYAADRLISVTGSYQDFFTDRFAGDFGTSL
jgi:hypothetical protein